MRGPMCQNKLFGHKEGLGTGTVCTGCSILLIDLASVFARGFYIFILRTPKKYAIQYSSAAHWMRFESRD